MKPWQVREAFGYISKYGTVPPPWVIFPDFHPQNVFWRGGTGKRFLMTWEAFWARQDLNQQQRLTYFRQFPPPAKWLGWVVDAVWSPPVSGQELEPLQVSYSQQLQALGFESWADYYR